MSNQTNQRQIICTCCPNEIASCRHKHTCDRNVKAVITNNTMLQEPDEPVFNRCSDCDGHDACEDFGCAIKQGLGHMVQQPL